MFTNSFKDMLSQSHKARRGRFHSGKEPKDTDTELVRLAKEFQTDKWITHSYIPIYE